MNAVSQGEHFLGFREIYKGHAPIHLADVEMEDASDTEHLLRQIPRPALGYCDNHAIAQRDFQRLGKLGTDKDLVLLFYAEEVSFCDRLIDFGDIFLRRRIDAI